MGVSILACGGKVCTECGFYCRRRGAAERRSRSVWSGGTLFLRSKRLPSATRRPPMLLPIPPKSGEILAKKKKYGGSD